MPDVQRNEGISEGLGLQRNRREQPVQAPLEATEIRDGLQLISGAGGNVVARAHDGGLLLVDSGAPQSAAALRAFLLERLGTARPELLFNTHWHWTTRAATRH